MRTVSLERNDRESAAERSAVRALGRRAPGVPRDGQTDAQANGNIKNGYNPAGNAENYNRANVTIPN